MKNYFIAGLAALTMVGGLTAEATALPVNAAERFVSVARSEARHNRLAEGAFNVRKAPAKASEQDVTLQPKLTVANGDEFLFIGAVRVVDGKNEIYGADVWDGECDPFTVPAGEYTLFAYGATKGAKGSILLVQEKVKIEAGVAVAFNTADATNEISIKQTSPSGQELKVDYDKDFTIGDAEDVITFNGEVACWSGMDLYKEQMYYLKTNVKEAPVKFTRIFFYPSATDGMLFGVTPVDLSKASAGAPSTGWKTIAQTIVDTPVKVRDMKVWEEAGLPAAEIPYTFVKYFITCDNTVRATIGSGITGTGFDAGKIGFWLPEGYDDQFGHVVFPMGSVVAGDDSSIKSMPVTCTAKDGPVQLGYNPVIDPSFMFTKEGKVLDHANPAFTGNVNGTVLGNCTPALVTVPNGTQIAFGYTGRHGEAFPIDSWNMAEKYTNASKLGDNTNTVKVFINDEEVCAKRVDFPKNIEWTKSGNYRIEFATDNILIDNEIPGVVKGTLTYDSRTYERIVPTLTLMQFVDSQGKVTDRFGLGKEARMSLYAASLNYYTAGAATQRYVYYNYFAPDEVTVEWAPTGTSDFKPLTVVPDPDGDFTPGFGNHYNVDLTDVTGKGWFDVRISVKAESGACQVQTITPAFHLTGEAGIDDAIVETAAPAEYFNLQGMPVAAPVKGQVVIVRRGTSVSKIIVD